MLNSCSESRTPYTVHIEGSLRSLMWEGKVNGVVDLDTLPDRPHLYGLGPAEYLDGELIIIDGKSYRSWVLTDSTMQVEETYQLKSPFFIYTHIESWKEHPLPDSVQTFQKLEIYLESVMAGRPQPFPFKLSGRVDRAMIHLVNLKEGTPVNSPEDVHADQVNYVLQDRAVDIIGFFSKEHQGVFTHHDTFFHMHLITQDKTQMGHLDGMRISKGNMKLYLPY